MTKFFEYEQDAEVTSIEAVKTFTGDSATIDTATANILKPLLQYAPTLPDFKGKGFAFADGTCYAVDAKGKVTKLEELPEWYQSPDDIKRGLTLAQFGLSSDSTLREAISALSGKADAVATIFSVRFNHPASTVERLKAAKGGKGSGKSTQTGVEVPTAHQVKHVIERLQAALDWRHDYKPEDYIEDDKERAAQHPLSIGNLTEGLPKRQDTQRQVRTVYKAIVGENVPNYNAIVKMSKPSEDNPELWEKIQDALTDLPDDFTEQLRAKVEAFMSEHGDKALLEDFTF